MAHFFWGAAAQELESIFFTDERGRTIYSSISVRFTTEENSLKQAAKKTAQAEKRKYYREYRRDVLKLQYSDKEAEELSNHEKLRPDQYEKALIQSYPMFYLAICFQLYANDRVGDLLCTQ